MKKFILLCVCTYLSVNGQVIYTDINPDNVISATIQNPTQQYDLDLNNDGTIDFNIKHNNYGGFLQTEFYTNFGQTGEILTNGTGAPLALNLNSTINSTLSNWVCTASASGNSALFMNANGASFVGQQDKYVGLRVNLNGQWHYGWARLNIPSDTLSISIKDYAYNQALDGSINAGQGEVVTRINNSFNKEQISLSVYPNPATKTLAVVLAQTGSQPMELVIVNQVGQEAFRRAIFTQITMLDATHFSEGIYFVHVTRDQQIICKKKIIINATN